ncbi:tetratricopeptide repeat protein [Dolichospermum sp. UHCC 0259]|nr:tetratricopeptide repeat protein [Dolichospermum sp. UHCC 0259]
MNFNHIDKHIEITQSGDNNVQTNIFSSQPTQLEGNPFTPPKPREGGLFGREDELEKLHQLLQSGKNVCVVSGMGGVGKTGLVREYANLTECISFFTGGVYYIDARDRQNMAAEIIALTKWRFKAELPANLSTQQMVTACWQQWKYQTENVLLILDDVSGLADIKTYLPPKDLVSLRLLMTSRETPDKRIAEKLELQVLSEAAAVDLLAAIIGQERIDAEPEQAKLLCYELGYLPLALELVAYYLDDEDYQDLSLLAMRGKLQEKVKHPALSPEEVPGGMEAQRGLQAAFDLSWEELKPEAKHLACVFGAFAASPVCWDFVTAIYQQLQGESFSEDDLKDRWLKSLRKLHLVMTIEENIYNLHLLIHDYFSEHLKQHFNHNQIKQVYCDVFIDFASNINDLINLETFNLIEPHLKKMIAWCEDNENTEFTFSLNGLAVLYYYQGRYSEAEPLYLQSLEIRKHQLGADHPAVAQSLNNLAVLYKAQGCYSKAEPLYLQSSEIWKHQLGTDNLSVALSFNNLAELYKAQRNYSKAEPLYLQSLEMRKRQLGADHPDVAQSLNNLASLYELQGYYSNAEPLYLQSLEIRKCKLGTDHPDVGQSLNNLALFFYLQGRYSDAEPLYLQSLEIAKCQLGIDHPEVATSLNNLAGLYYSQGRYGDAELLFLQSLEIEKQKLGTDHPNVAQCLNNLAELYRIQERYTDAEPLFLQSLEIKKRQLGTDHPNVAQGLNNLALLYSSQGRYNDAEPLYLQSLEIRKLQLGTDHFDVVSSLNSLAFLYEAQGKYSKAEDLAKQVLAIYQKKLGNEHPSTQNAIFAIKGWHIQNLLHCNTEILSYVLHTLAQQANFPVLNTETALILLEMIESNPDLLSFIRELLQQQTKTSDGDI